jgi:hexokinase
MDIQAFMDRHNLKPENIDGAACLEQLLKKMEQGLAGEGNIPMIPSYLSLNTRPVVGQPCCVVDAGGTNLRVAKAVFDEQGKCRLSDFFKTEMPGTKGELSFKEFYGTLADFVRETGCTERVGLCFSYNVLQDRTLDGILHSWCKEVRVPEAPGKPVGASLRRAVGAGCGSVNVLNDSTAALLGAHGCDPEITVGLIMGTGINICYSEQCDRIPKVEKDLRQDSMIISTEIGEFDGFPKSTFDRMVIDASDEPAMAHAEKQCAGAYLGDLISLAWQTAAKEGLIDKFFAQPVTLPQISDYLAGKCSEIPEDAAAKEIAKTMIHRAAKIAAVLTAGPVIRSCAPEQTCTMVIEGSQFRKLTFFADLFRQELSKLLIPGGITFAIREVENSCLIGAAIAAFAESM